MNLLVALLAGDQGFATAHRHPLHPLRFFLPSWLIQICQLANVMNFAFQF